MSYCKLAIKSSRHTPDPNSNFFGGPCLLSSCFVYFLWTFDFGTPFVITTYTLEKKLC